MNAPQILDMLNDPIYDTLPMVDQNITFIDLVKALMNLIDGARLKHYMVLTLEHTIENMDIDDPELENINAVPFDATCQTWQNHFHVILDQATEQQCFIMLNLLNILNLQG